MRLVSTTVAKPVNMQRRERYIADLISLLHQYWLGTLDELCARIREAENDQPRGISFAQDD